MGLRIPQERAWGIQNRLLHTGVGHASLQSTQYTLSSWEVKRAPARVLRQRLPSSREPHLPHMIFPSSRALKDSLASGL
ncbi:hypothetical protein EYF80_017029 [Liparis tanakae]|uniref:Uncharacterized protein n=1 Tax=Liparis tanakae TaxID=230148 RepID=A0A4Z2I5K9_9TELE|nr:hypothetical protein EYF80_017029 [Liparis tanakae]